MRTVSVFDFDGTLTHKDTMIEFVKFTRGPLSLYFGLIVLAPLIALMKLRLYPNYRLKEIFFSLFFKGEQYNTFKAWGERFAARVNEFTNQDTIQILSEHCKNGGTIYVVTASITEWVIPWCRQHGIKNVLGTTIEVKNNKLTGKFLSKNCYGIEKVRRLLAVEPNREEYFLYAFGDSRGDREMINFADKGVYIK